MADQNVEHLGVMAYAAYFQWVRPRPLVSEQVAVHVDSTSARVHQPVRIYFKHSLKFVQYFVFNCIIIHRRILNQNCCRKKSILEKFVAKLLVEIIKLSVDYLGMVHMERVLLYQSKLECTRYLIKIIFTLFIC